MEYAIIESNVVTNIVVADASFAESQGWIKTIDGVQIGWGYVDNMFIPPPPPDYSTENKQRAELLLQQTDWTATVDISSPEYSNPYLVNQAEFLAYRSTVRQIAVNPPTEPATFPTKPEEVWSEAV